MGTLSSAHLYINLKDKDMRLFRSFRNRLTDKDSGVVFVIILTLLSFIAYLIALTLAYITS